MYENEPQIIQAAASGNLAYLTQEVTSEALANQLSTTRYTPLVYAVLHGHLDCVKLLLSRGASLTPQSANGESPLHLAIPAGHQACVEELLEWGADPQLKNRQGKTPLDLAWMKKDPYLFLMLFCYDHANKRQNLSTLEVAQTFIPVFQKIQQKQLPLPDKQLMELYFRLGESLASDKPKVFLEAYWVLEQVVSTPKFQLPNETREKRNILLADLFLGGRLICRNGKIIAINEDLLLESVLQPENKGKSERPSSGSIDQESLLKGLSYLLAAGHSENVVKTRIKFTNLLLGVPDNEPHRFGDPLEAKSIVEIITSCNTLEDKIKRIRTELQNLRDNRLAREERIKQAVQEVNELRLKCARLEAENSTLQSLFPLQPLSEGPATRSKTRSKRSFLEPNPFGDSLDPQFLDSEESQKTSKRQKTATKR